MKACLFYVFFMPWPSGSKRRLVYGESWIRTQKVIGDDEKDTGTYSPFTLILLTSCTIASTQISLIRLSAMLLYCSGNSCGLRMPMLHRFREFYIVACRILSMVVNE